MAEQFCQAFDTIRRYAERAGWIPIGWREFTVGPWKIIVNGTRDERNHVKPYHTLVEHQEILAIMMFSPFGGSVGGWQGAEAEFIRDMETELSTRSSTKTT